MFLKRTASLLCWSEGVELNFKCDTKLPSRTGEKTLRSMYDHILLTNLSDGTSHTLIIHVAALSIVRMTLDRRREG